MQTAETSALKIASISLLSHDSRTGRYRCLRHVWTNRREECSILTKDLCLPSVWVTNERGRTSEPATTAWN